MQKLGKEGIRKQGREGGKIANRVIDSIVKEQRVDGSLSDSS